MSAHPEPWRSLSGLIKKLDERIRRLENRPTFYGSGLEVVDDGQIMQDGAVTIPANGLLLVDGGDVIMLDQNMVELFRIGVMEGGDRGIRIRRSDGGVAFEVRDILGLGVQSIAIRDSEGAQIGGTGLFGAGLGSPYIPIGWIPSDYTSASLAQSTSATSWTALHEHWGYKQNNVVNLLLKVRCSDSLTAAEVRVFSVTNGAQMTDFNLVPLSISVPPGTTGWTLVTFPAHLYLPGSYGAPVTYQIEARVVSGAGSVSVAPVRSIGARDTFMDPPAP